MLDMRIKSLFFNSKAVLSKVDGATRRVLSKFGAFVRTTAKQSIRKRKAISRPGNPPSSHVGTLKRLIFFGYDPSQRSVVIGPAPFGKGKAPALLEYGGHERAATMMVAYGEIGRSATGQFTTRSRREIPAGTLMRIAPRPFMGPAFEKEKPKLPAMWADSIKA